MTDRAHGSTLSLAQFTSLVPSPDSQSRSEVAQMSLCSLFMPCHILGCPAWDAGAAYHVIRPYAQQYHIKELCRVTAVFSGFEQRDVLWCSVSCDYTDAKLGQQLSSPRPSRITQFIHNIGFADFNEISPWPLNQETPQMSHQPIIFSERFLWRSKDSLRHEWILFGLGIKRGFKVTD